MFNQYLKLLHIQWEQKFSDDVSDLLRVDLKQSLYNQSSIEQEFISLSKSKSENQQQYENFFNQKREFPFFSTYLIINTIIKEYYTQTENILSELSTSIDISNLSIQQLTIESIIDCMDNLIYEYEKLKEINEIVKQVLIDVFYEVGGNVTIFITNMMQNNDQKLQQQIYIKAFINLQKLIKNIISLSFKKQCKMMPLIYQILLGNTLYLTYLKNNDIQNFFQIFELFQQCFLQNSMQIKELSDIEQFQDQSFCQVYFQCLKINYQQMQYIQFIQLNAQKWIDQIKELNDINYYLIYIYLIQVTEFFDNIQFNTEIIQIRNQQIIQLIQQKNHKVVGLLLNQLLSNQKLQCYLQIFDLIIQNENNETKLSYYILIGEQLLQITNTKILNIYLDIHIKELKEFVNENNLNIQQIIQFITYLCRYYQQFNEQQKIEFNSSLIQFYSYEIEDQQFYRKFDKNVLKLIENESIYEQIIDIAITNSSTTKQHSYGFLNFVYESIQQNSESFQHILRYISILMKSCKKNKKGEYQKKISYKKGRGTKILNYLLSNMRNFITIVKTIQDLIIKDTNTNVGQFQIYIEIYNKITCIIYMSFWLIDDKGIMNSAGIQETCLELCQIHYKFTINLIIILQQAGNLESNTLYQIINNINVIAYGYDYITYIKNSYFDKNESLVNISDLFALLNQRKIQLNLVFNKFYETSISILFEVPNIPIDRKFYLHLLKFQLTTQISLVLTFQDFCSKFIFYFRLERNPEIISLMQECIIIVIQLNQDTQIIKQLFETLSQHQSTILMNDLDNLKLDANDQNEIQQAYKLANLSPNRIILLQQRSILINLVEDKNYYIKVYKIIIEIFYQVYQKWKQMLQQLQEQQNLLYFQGGASSIHMNFMTHIPIQLIVVKMRLKLFIQENEVSSLQDLDERKFGSFIDNHQIDQKQILFTLFFTMNQEIQIAIRKQKFFIIYKEDDIYQEQDYQTNLDLSQWFNLDFQIQNNEFLILQVNEQSFNFEVKQIQKQKLQIYLIILGVNMNKQNNFKNFQFYDSIDLLDQESFEGQISEFNLIINKQKIQLEQSKKPNSQKQTLNFINSRIINEKELPFGDIFCIIPHMQSDITICLQNVYIIDMKKGIDFIQQCGGFNIFYMILDLLYTIVENQNVSDSEEIIILVLKLFKENIQLQGSNVNNVFNSQNLYIMEENCKKWIQINQRVSDKFIIQLRSIYSEIQNEQASILYLITMIKILDNKFTTFDQIKMICTRSLIQDVMMPNCLRKLINIHLQFESRYLFTLVSLDKGQTFTDIEAIHLFSHSLSKCVQYQGVVVQIININPINNFFNLLLSQYSFNLFTLDILQIIEILIRERFKQNSKLKEQEEKILNNFKMIIIQILDRQQKQQTKNESFLYEFEVIDKLHELTFSIYFQIVQQLRHNSKQDNELNSLQIYYDNISYKKQTQVGYYLITKILFFIRQFEEDEVLINQLLMFLILLYSNQIINDQIKETITIWFLDVFRNVALRKQQSDILVGNLVKFQDFPLLMKHLMINSINKKENSSDLFTYYIIYLIEMYQHFTSEILYKVHIQSNIINNDSFNSFLQAIYPTIIQFYALKQVQQFEGKEDEKKLINIIIVYLHIEQCIGVITNLQCTNWNKYSQIMEKGIDLFNYLGILFYDLNYFIPCKDDTFTLEQIRQDYDKFKKQGNRLMPNGGIKRLMRQLIAPFVRIPQMKKPIRNYLQIDKFNIEGRIDQQSCQQIKQIIEQEFSVPLLQTKQQYQKQVIDLYHRSFHMELNQKKEKKSKLMNHSIFYYLLAYYALVQDSSLNEISIDKQELKNQDDLQEIFGQFKLTKLIHWQNVDDNQVECLIYQRNASLSQLLMTFNNLNTFKQQTIQNQKSIHDNRDLSQIDSFNDELVHAIRLSIFMDIQIYYQFIHKLWLLYPNILDLYVKPKTQSNLLIHPKSQTIPLFIDSHKQDQKSESMDEQQRQQLCFIIEQQLQELQQELNNFITHKKFKFEILQSMQLNKAVCLEDITRKRVYLKMMKQIQFNYSYYETVNQVGKLMQRTTTRSSIKIEQIIQYKVNQAITNFRKWSPDNKQIGIIKYYCEYITQEGAYQGVLTFNETNQSIQFQQEEIEFQELLSSPEVIRTTEDIFLEIPLDQIVNVHPRRFLLMEIAIEIFIHRQNYFFNLFKTQEQQELLQEFKKKKVIVIDPKLEFKKMKYQQNWVEGKLSNFQYLMLVNTFSGRTYNDLSQYFIFPWVISNYKSQQIDLAQKKGSNIFRNLKLPIGTISKNPQQIINDYKERELEYTYENYQHKYHYSNAGIVLNYLIRLKPFKLIEHFCMPDKVFSSIDNSWEDSIKYDNKELIPEFYNMPEFLKNNDIFSFETSQQKSQIPDVVLPKWVKTQTAEEFIYLMRLALESDEVSSQLNHWIDLIFGINNNGQNSVDKLNVFHYQAYKSNLNRILNNNDDHETIQKYLTQVYYFGQTPKQLFQKAHQERKHSLSIFTNQIPQFGNYPDQTNKWFAFSKRNVDDNMNKSQIIGIYPYSNKCIYILKADDEKFNNLTLLETQQLDEELYYYYYLYPKQQIELPEINVDGCNPQNLFTFIYEQEYTFGDGYDSQFYSVYQEKQNYNLYFCLVGFQDFSVKIYDLRNKMKEIDIDISFQNTKRQKRASCVRYHAVSKILAIGSLDGLLQLFQLQFDQQIQSKGVLTKKLKNGILCIDLTDLLILTIDYKNIVSLLTLEGDLLQTIYLDNSDKFQQCCIQMYFLVFKSVNSQISIFTMNGQQYLKTMTLQDKVSQNILFTTPFSSKFLLYSLNQEKNLLKYDPIIYCYDIFDLKLQEQQQGILKFDQIVIKKGNLKGSGISNLHISFDRYSITNKNEIKLIYLIAFDYQILCCMDEKYNINQRRMFVQQLKKEGISLG